LINNIIDQIINGTYDIKLTSDEKVQKQLEKQEIQEISPWLKEIMWKECKAGKLTTG